ncbi:MAG: amino acid ABC transporter substrate-binding protein [Burkholderiaceae bacterium]
MHPSLKWHLRAALGGLVLASAIPVLAQTAAPAAPAATPQPPTLARIRDTGVITVAYREASIPFSYLDQNKRPVGYAMDLCMRVVESLRRDLKMPSLRVELLSVTPATRIGAIKEGKADLECGSTTNNAARRRDVGFTVTHYYAGAKLLTRTDSGISRLSDLRGKAIVSTRGTTPLAALRAAEEKGIIGGARILEGKDHDESFAMLERGEVQAFAMDDILLYSLRATAKDPKAWAVVGEFITVEPLAIMLRRDDPEFKKYVDTVLSRAMIDGDVRSLYNKWFLSAIPPKGVNLGIPLSPLMRDQLSFPTDKVGDQLGG